MEEETKLSDGGPAFPTDQPVFMFPNDLPKEWRDKCFSIAAKTSGMSLRDWFAGMALQGILANPATANLGSMFTKDGWMQPDLLADCCYEQADAMLKERSK